MEITWGHGYQDTWFIGGQYYNNLLHLGNSHFSLKTQFMPPLFQQGPSWQTGSLVVPSLSCHNTLHTSLPLHLPYCFLTIYLPFSSPPLDKPLKADCALLIFVFPGSSPVSRTLCLTIMSFRTSLMAQWLRIRLPLQGTWVRALVREDPTCCGATKPVCHNYWACVPQLLKLTHLEPMLHNERSHCNEKPTHYNEE